MDITRELCRVNSSVKPKELQLDEILPFAHSTELHTGTDFTFNTEELIAAVSYNQIDTVNKVKQSDSFYGRIGTSIFSNDTAIVLANIDVLLDIFPKINDSVSPDKSEDGAPAGLVEFQSEVQKYGGSISPQYLARAARYPVCFCNDIGFCEYIQWKYPLSFNYINSPVGDQKALDKICTEIMDLRVNNMILKIKSENTTGLNIMIIDSKPTDFSMVYTLNLIVKILANDGTVVMKIDCSSGGYESYVYILSIMFEEIFLIKPCSINLFDSYLYIVCKHYGPVPEITNYIELLSENTIDVITKNINIKQEDLKIILNFPDVLGINDYIVSKVKEIVDLRKNWNGKFVPQRALLYWGLPGNIEKKQK